MKKARHPRRPNTPAQAVERSSTESVSELPSAQLPSNRPISRSPMNRRDPRLLTPDDADSRTSTSRQSSQPRYRVVSPLPTISATRYKDEAKPYTEINSSTRRVRANSEAANRASPLLQLPNAHAPRSRSRSPSHPLQGRGARFADDSSSAVSADEENSFSSLGLKSLGTSRSRHQNSTPSSSRQGGRLAPQFTTEDVRSTSITSAKRRNTEARADTVQKDMKPNRYQLAEANSQSTLPYAAMMVPRLQALEKGSFPEQPPSLAEDITPDTSVKTPSEENKPQPQCDYSPTVVTEASLAPHPLSRARASTLNSDLHYETITPQLDLDRSISEQAAHTRLRDASGKDRFPYEVRGPTSASGTKNFEVGNQNLQSEDEHAIGEERRHRERTKRPNGGLRSKSVGPSSHSSTNAAHRLVILEHISHDDY